MSTVRWGWVAGLVTGLALAGVPTPAAAQEREPTTLRVGLALSGGSAKGFAHVGVLRVLEELGVPVDLVAGTSMGSLVGGLYAMGMGPDEIQERLADLDWTALFSDERQRADITVDRRLAGERALLSFPIRNGQVGLPSGVVRGERGTRALHQLTWPAHAIRDFGRLPIPFAAVATDIETGEAVVLRTGVLAEAIRASIAIPGVIRPFRVGDRLLVDGAVVRNLPAQDVRAMGADLVICSDVSGPLARAEDLGSLFEVLLQTVSFQMQASTERQRRLCDILVDVDVEGLSSVAFTRGDEWVRRGEDAARALADTLRAVAERAGARAPRPGLVRDLLEDSVRVARVVIQGADGRPGELALRTAGLSGGTMLGPEAVDRALGRLYATDRFDQVSYHLEVRGQDTALVLSVIPQPQDRLGFGFRYDDRQQAALLFTASLHSWPTFAADTHLELRLGEEVELGARVVRGFGLLSRFSLAGDVRHTRAVFERFEDERRVASFRARVTSMAGFVGMALGRTTVAGTRLALERATSATVIAPTDTSRQATVVSATARVFRDTFDRAAYPTRGIRLLLSSEWADRSVAGGATFRLHHARVEQLVPVSDGTTLRFSALTGLGEGDDLPLHRLFFLGGAYPSAVLGETRIAFPGLRPDQRSGQAVHLVALAVQRRLRPQLFLTLAARTGTAGTDWHVAPDRWERGWSAALGSLTPLGPLEVTLAGVEGSDPMVSVNLGFAF